MVAMPDRQTPAQAGLFDPPTADAARDAGAADAVIRSDAAAAGEPLPLPAFLAPADAAAEAAGASPRAARSGLPLWARLLGRPLHPWLKLDIEADPQLGADARPICYVLEDYGLSNALILARACREAGLPPPLQPIAGDPLGRKRAYVALSRRHANALGLLPGAEHKTHSGSLARLLAAHGDNPALDVRLVPVSIFVGQAPKRSSGWFRVLF